MLEALSTLHVFLLMGALRMTLELRVVAKPQFTASNFWNTRAISFYPYFIVYTLRGVRVKAHQVYRGLPYQVRIQRRRLRIYKEAG
jgi:hypothetical protein